MIAVVAEGAHIVYFAQQNPPLLETTVGMNVALVPPFMEGWLSVATDFRLALQRGLPSDDRALVYYLHWDNGQDLTLLDQKVQENGYEDSDFMRSIRTVYQLTICDRCGKAWPTLVAPTGDPYMGAPGLHTRKLREHVFIRFCPVCGTSFRQLVAKILIAEKVADSR